MDGVVVYILCTIIAIWKLVQLRFINHIYFSIYNWSVPLYTLTKVTTYIHPVFFK